MLANSAQLSAVVLDDSAAFDAPEAARSASAPEPLALDGAPAGRVVLSWRNALGERHDFTAAELARWADKTAGFLAAQGVRAGDAVAVSLRHHYQLWFVAQAARQLGARLVVLPDGATEPQVAQMLTQAQVKLVVCTNQGRAVDVVDHVVYLCPSVKARVLVNADGADAFFADPADELAAAELPAYPCDGLPHGAALSGAAGVCALGCIRPGWVDFNTCVRVARALPAAPAVDARTGASERAAA